MKCFYRARGASSHNLNIELNYKKNKSEPLIILFNRFNGQIVENSLNDLNVSNKEMTIDELLEEFLTSKRNNLLYDELKKVVSWHNVDLELRKIILQLISLKLIYSRKTIPERGYQRAQLFIQEINENIDDLNSNSELIDSLINMDYSLQDNNKLKRR